MSRLKKYDELDIIQMRMELIERRLEALERSTSSRKSCENLEGSMMREILDEIKSLRKKEETCVVVTHDGHSRDNHHGEPQIDLGQSRSRATTMARTIM